MQVFCFFVLVTLMFDMVSIRKHPYWGREELRFII